MPNLDPRPFDSLYELTRQDYTDREDVKLIFQKWDEADTKFLGHYEDLEELNQLQEHEIYFS